jgi:hypothetical protein
MNYMVRILSFLCLFLTSNSFAENNGWHRCGWNSDWYCYTPPSCTDQTEVRTQSCLLPHQSGGIQETRFYSCQTQSWTNWQQTSNNCTQEAPTCAYSAITEQRACGQNEIGYKIYKKEQNCPDPYGSPIDSGWYEVSNSCQPAPATCHTITESRNESCLPGYEGVVTQLKTSSCSTPYSMPMFSEWVTISDTCKMTMTNANNILSPVSPISPANPVNVLSAPVAPAEVESATNTTVTISSVSNTPSETTTSSGKENTKTQELVPGLGLVLSIGMLTKSGLDITQPPMVDSYNLAQEDEYGLQQGIFMGLIIETTIYDSFNAYSSSRNTNLLRNYNFQQNAFSR